MNPPLPVPDLDHLLLRLRQARDELVVQGHLLAMEADDEVRALAHQAGEIARSIDAARPAGGHVGAFAVQAHLAWMDARDAVDAWRSDASREASRARRRAEDALSAIASRFAPLDASLDEGGAPAPRGRTS